MMTPLGDRVDRPLRMAVVWGVIALMVGGLIATLVGAVGFLVSWIATLVGEGTASWPADLVRNVGAVAAPFTIASSTWAAAFLSTDRMPAGRAVGATALGVLLLVALAGLESAAVLVAAAGAAWALAIPFEHWGRLGARLGAIVIAGGSAHVGLADLIDGNPILPWALVVVASFPVAALVLALSDRLWRLATRRSGPAKPPGR